MTQTVTATSDWTLLELVPPKHLGGLKTAVLVGAHLEDRQISTTTLTNRSAGRHSRNKHNRTRCPPGDGVCLPQKPRRRKARAKRHVTTSQATIIHSQLACMHWMWDLNLWYGTLDDRSLRLLLLFYCYFLLFITSITIVVMVIVSVKNKQRLMEIN